MAFQPSLTETEQVEELMGLKEDIKSKIMIFSECGKQPKLALFFAHVISHMNYVSNTWDGYACVHMKQLYSLHKGAVKLLMPIPNLDYKKSAVLSNYSL